MEKTFRPNTVKGRSWPTAAIRSQAVRALNDQEGAGVYQWRQAELAKLEASDNIGIDNLKDYALTGIDHLSIGSLTKHVTAVDPSMRFE